MSHSDFDAVADNETAACPECDASTVRTLSPGSMTGPEKDISRYQCWTCDASFDEFIVRERRGHSNSQSGLAKKLLEADPDEVGHD